jgi:CID domain
MASLAAAAPSAAAAHSLSANRMDAESESEVIEVDDDDDDDENIDEEQLEEYQEMVEQLGSFPVRTSSSNAALQPIQACSEGLSRLDFLAFCIASRTHCCYRCFLVQDKVAINSLSMVAEDHADSRGSARQIYNVIRNRLVTTSNNSNLLPLVYVLDSILKNVKGRYIQVIEDDAETWLGGVYRKLPDLQKQKLKKVYQTWVDARLFSEERLKAMGLCLEGGGGGVGGASVANQSSSSALSGGLRTNIVAGITRAVRIAKAFLALFKWDSSPVLNSFHFVIVVVCCLVAFLERRTVVAAGATAQGDGRNSGPAPVGHGERAR